jgi:lipid-binding SYLF domain-containing protein
MKTILTASLCALLAAATVAHAWDPREVDKLHAGAEKAKAAMLEQDASMERFFDTAAGWVIIPTVGKAGVGLGGALGKGLLYEKGRPESPTAIVRLVQVTVGFQWGGQAYSEFLFLRDEAALENFKRGDFELGAQASAVAVTVGASADANYSNGVAVFTHAKGGLMYEATVGGQRFKVAPLE